MKPLYTLYDFESSKSTEKLPCQCYHCNKTFYKMKKEIQSFFNGNPKNTIKFCSIECRGKFKNKRLLITCLNCNNEFSKRQCEIQKSPNHFCSRSCAATHNNKHKTHGNRRSKLEKWIEEQLTNLYPQLDIHFNKKDAIGSELDIYIPSLNLAFELNGIFHYEPIYGTDKLQKIQENDISKSKACHDRKIDLCIIDTSQQKYVKPSTSQKYLDIITNIISSR